MNGICPNCDETIILNNSARRNDSVDCPVCGEPLKVKKLYPLELDYDMSEYEYEDEDYEYEEY